jgi:hypothetical protein
MNHAAKGSNLATTHPEPTFPTLIKPTAAPQTLDEEEDARYVHHQSGSYANASHNDAYGYHPTGRNEMEQHRYGTHQGYAESQQYQGSTYDQHHPDEPEFEPVHPPAVAGSYHPNAYQGSSASHSMHHGQQQGYPNQQPAAAAAAYPVYGQTSTYPQPTHSPAPAAAAPDAYPRFQQHMETPSQEQYGQAYSNEEPLPPAYPAGSVGHTHDHKS